MSAVKLNNVVFSYGENEPTILNGLSLEIAEGEFVAVVGRNGSGKSTLAKLINGLIAPLSGEVSVLGLKADKKNLFEIRKSCGIVFQNPDNQMVASIVEDDVAFGPENVGVSRGEIGERIDFALSATGTAEFRHRTAANLSGGQKQRVAIAGVLALKPKILILDESTSMLDPKGREDVMSVVRRLNEEEKMTVIVITHYMDEVVGCDRVLVVDGGRISAEGTPAEIFSRRDALIAAGLDLPLPLYVSERLRELGVGVGDNLTVEELGDELCGLFQED